MIGRGPRDPEGEVVLGGELARVHVHVPARTTYLERAFSSESFGSGRTSWTSIWEGELTFYELLCDAYGQLQLLLHALVHTETQTELGDENKEATSAAVTGFGYVSQFRAGLRVVRCSIESFWLSLC